MILLFANKLIHDLHITVIPKQIKLLLYFLYTFIILNESHQQILQKGFRKLPSTYSKKFILH